MIGKRIIIGSFVLTLGVISITMAALGEKNDDGKAMKEYIEGLDLDAVYQNSNINENIYLHYEDPEEEMEKSNRYYKNYDRFMEDIEENGVPYYYGGCYNSDGSLVINVTDLSAAEDWKILSEIDCILSKVDYSQKELEDTYEEFKERAFVFEGDNVTCKYPEMYASILDIMENRIIIVTAEGGREKLVEFDSFYDNPIFLVKQSGGAHLASSYVRGGSTLYNTSGSGWGSAGYRAKWTNAAGTTYYGFVTADHLGGNMYYNADGSSLGFPCNELDSPALGIDAAFIRIVHPDYLPSNTVLYSNSSGGTYGVSLSGDPWMSYISTGNTLYKSGKSTYLTSGNVLSFNSNMFIFNGQAYQDMICATTYIQNGDSGGVAYCAYDSSYVKAGIVTGYITIGGSFAYSFFTKAGNIYSNMDIIPY